jgi:hypothetical protein
VYCIALILIIGALAIIRGRESPSTAPSLRTELSLRDVLLGVGLLMLPVIGAFFTQFVTHAYVPRYFLPAAIGFAVCLSYSARSFSRLLPGLMLFLIVSLGLGFGKAVLQEYSHKAEPLPSLDVLAAERTPLLFDTPANYAQIYHYFPTLRSSMWVIADPPASLRYRQYDTDDKIMLALAQQGRAQTISLSAAVRRWPNFRLVPRSADYIWALKCVMDVGSRIEVKHPFGNSNFVFEVRVQPETIAQVDACAQPAR